MNPRRRPPRLRTTLLELAVSSAFISAPGMAQFQFDVVTMLKTDAPISSLNRACFPARVESSTPD